MSSVCQTHGFTVHIHLVAACNDVLIAEGTEPSQLDAAATRHSNPRPIIFIIPFMSNASYIAS